MSMIEARAQTVVIAEDEFALRELLVKALSGFGYEVRGARNGEEAMQLLLDSPPDIFVTDVKLPDANGLDLLKSCRERYPKLSVIVMTGFASIHSAVEAMKQGAADYLPKPFTTAQLRFAIERVINTRELTNENARLRDKLRKQFSYDEIIGKSEPMQRVFALMERVKHVDSTVLVTGESGSGKELIVRALHKGHPTRSSKPFVEVHCGAIPRELIESELFGHTRGSFTGADKDKIGRFEAANGGTIFLDEVSTMPADLQVKLLRVLQTRSIQRVGETRSIPVDVRVVAASNENLKELVARGRFREDLYYRLNVIPISVPPIRARRSDIPLLAVHFCQKYADANGLPPKDISQSAMRILLRHDWPGNVRELENAIEYAVVMTGRGPSVEARSLPPEFSELDEGSNVTPYCLTEAGLSFRTVVSEIEKDLILRSLEIANGNKSRAAELLELKRTTFVEKLKRIQSDEDDPLLAAC